MGWGGGGSLDISCSIQLNGLHSAAVQMNEHTHTHSITVEKTKRRFKIMLCSAFFHPYFVSIRFGFYIILLGMAMSMIVSATFWDGWSGGGRIRALRLTSECLHYVIAQSWATHRNLRRRMVWCDGTQHLFVFVIDRTKMKNKREIEKKNPKKMNQEF